MNPPVERCVLPLPEDGEVRSRARVRGRLAALRWPHYGLHPRTHRAAQRMGYVGRPLGLAPRLPLDLGSTGMGGSDRGDRFHRAAALARTAYLRPGKDDPRRALRARRDHTGGVSRAPRDAQADGSRPSVGGRCAGVFSSRGRTETADRVDIAAETERVCAAGVGARRQHLSPDLSSCALVAWRAIGHEARPDLAVDPDLLLLMY